MHAAVGGRRLPGLVGAVGRRLRGVAGVLEGRHERDDEVQRYRAQRREAVDIAEVQVAREEEEEAEQTREQDGSAQVAVVHQVLVDAAEGIEHGESLWSKKGKRSVVLPPAFRFRHHLDIARTHLGLYVREVDAQLFEQRRLALVALGGEGGDPARPQPARLSHAPRD